MLWTIDATSPLAPPPPQVSLEGAAGAVFRSRVVASLQACVATAVAPATERGLGLDCFVGTDLSVALSVARCRFRGRMEALAARIEGGVATAANEAAEARQSPLALLEARLGGEEYDLVRTRARRRRRDVASQQRLALRDHASASQIVSLHAAKRHLLISDCARGIHRGGHEGPVPRLPLTYLSPAGRCAPQWPRSAKASSRDASRAGR